MGFFREFTLNPRLLENAFYNTFSAGKMSKSLYINKNNTTTMNNNKMENLGDVGQSSPLDAGANAFVRMFKPDIIFLESDIEKNHILVIKMDMSGKEYILDFEKDRVIYTDSRDNVGVYFQVHEAEQESVHYMTIWAKGPQDGEREYGVKVLFVQNRRTGRIRTEEARIIDVRRGE